MDYGFETEDMQRAFSTILMSLQEPEELSIYKPSSPPNKKINKKNEKKIVKPANNHFSSVQKFSPVKSSKKINAKEFNNTTLARMNMKIQKKTDDIEKKRKLLEEKETESLKNKPDISLNSKKISKRSKPVYIRAEKEKIESSKRILEIKSKLEAEKEAKILPELTFKPNISSNNSNKRTTEEFFQYNLEWESRKNKRIELQRAEIEEKIISELKFCPEINSNSTYIAEHIGNTGPIVERLLKSIEKSNQRKEENIKQLEFSFKPYIGQRSRKLARNVTEKDVIKRLYSLSNERASSSTRSPKFGSKRNKSYTFINATPDETQKSLEITFSE